MRINNQIGKTQNNQKHYEPANSKKFYYTYVTEKTHNKRYNFVLKTKVKYKETEFDSSTNIENKIEKTQKNRNHENYNKSRKNIKAQKHIMCVIVKYDNTPDGKNPSYIGRKMISHTKIRKQAT